MSTLSKGPGGPGAGAAKRGTGGVASTRSRGSRGLHPPARQDHATRGGNRDSVTSARGGRGRGGNTPSTAMRGSVGTTRGGGKMGVPGANGNRGDRPPSATGSHRGHSTKTTRGTRMPSAASPFSAVQPNIDHSRDPRYQKRAGQSKTTGQQDYNSRYEQLKQDRAKERTRAIQSGLMADPNQPTSLNRAITPTGTCTDMCPEFERVERMVQKMVDKSEKFLDPESESYQNVESKMIKRFRRSAAGYDEQLPSDIRTPKTLLQTMNYMLRHVLSDNEGLGTIHKFVWDRTRSIRNDLSIQQVTQASDVEIAVKCLERIARFHILSLHLLSSPDNTEQFDHHQEREQLNNTLLSLLYYYDDNRERINFPHEDEFRAYYIVFSIHDQRPDLEARVQKWPRELRQSPRVQVALELFAAAGNNWEYQGALDAKRPNAISQGFYSRFFNIVKSDRVSYLMGCIAEVYFNQIRQTTIRSIWKAYCRHPLSQQHKNQEWTVDELTTVLSFDDRDQTIAFCEEQGLQLTANAEGHIYLNWADRPLDSVDFQPSSEQVFSDKLVESKRRGRTLVALILGMNVVQGVRHGMIDEPLSASRSESAQSEREDGLFVSDDEGQDATAATGSALFGSQPAAGAGAFSFQHQQNTKEQTNSVFTSSSQSKPQLSAAAPTFTPQSSVGPTPAQSSNPLSSPFQNKPSTNFGAAVNASGDSQANKTSSASPATFPSSFTSGAQPSFTSTFGSGFGVSNPFQNAQATPSSPSQSVQDPFASTASSVDNPTSASGPSPTQNPNPFAQWKGAEMNKPSTPVAADTNPSIDNNATEAPKPRNPLFERLSSHGFGQPSMFGQAQSGPPKESGIFSQALLAESDGKTPSASPPTTVTVFPSASQNPKQSDNQTLQGAVSNAPTFNWFGASSNSTLNDGSKQPGKRQAEDGVASEQRKAEQDAKERAKKETERREAEKREAERIEEMKQAEMREAERKEAERREVERKEAERREAERKEAERKEAERKEAERKEEERKEAEKKAAAERETAKREKEIRDREMAQRQAHEVKAAQRDIARFKAAEKKTQDREASMKEAIQQEVNKRKAIDEEEEHTSSKGKSKAPRISGEGLLTVEELLGDFDEPRPKSPEPKSTAARKPLINEDEILLSSARLVASTLAKDRLFHRDSVQDFGASVSSSSGSPYIAPSRARSLNSVVERDRAVVNGHDVALAPSTPMGLGRSLSRTEQRIRSTGAKGLAYKPITSMGRSTSTKEPSKRKTKRSKRNRSPSAAS